MVEKKTPHELKNDDHDVETHGILAKIALDGCCRTGKGEQLSALHKHFTNLGIPTMVLRGAGARRGAGEAWYDLGSRYWTHRFTYHSGVQTPYAERDVDDFTLARENRVWIQSLGRLAKVTDAGFAAAIFDRSVLSRAALALQREKMKSGVLTVEQMWPSHLQTPGDEITYEETLPDILFNLSAPREILASRISIDDPNRAFRLRAVYEFYEYFEIARDALPPQAPTKIVDLDGEAPVHVNSKHILEHLYEFYPHVPEFAPEET